MNTILTTADRGQRTERPSLLPDNLAALPMLIRNDEAQIENYTRALEECTPGTEFAARTQRSLGDRIRLLQRRRAALEYFTPAAAEDSSLAKQDAGFSVTTKPTLPGVSHA